jgi:hypothetical protein
MEGDLLMSRKIAISLILVLVTMLLLQSNAFAFESFSSDIELENIKTKLLESGLESRQANALIQKLEKDELWDSMNPEKEPIKILTKTEGADVYKTYIYEDRSSVTTSIYGGSSQSGTGYVNWTGRTVEASGLLFTYSYKVDYTLVQDYYDTIEDVYDYSITQAVGSYSNVSLRIVREDETSSKKAEGRLSLDVQWPTPPQSGTCSVSVLVGNNSASVSYNDYY